MQQIPGAGQQVGPRDRWAKFRGLSWWQLVLSLLPLVLAGLGGALGGVIGAAALFANLAIARKQFATPLKVLAMVGVVVASYFVFLVILVLLTS
ncbi:hypothetical protein GCM10023194_32090 [Planotetraspora phitsanulokensis]|uniref:Uncharacterized protein n=1 Tax=Planotetraspora phitsanulokensis TaxID=575192 RepID=A0A8J3TZI7_9ACTN|nr:hypothetical protein [Planotetraspora phitsanulokensis]GII35653.1 hypothetical protein Pph01_06560 [Planotetraspora phitsanulokensis]